MKWLLVRTVVHVYQPTHTRSSGFEKPQWLCLVIASKMVDWYQSRTQRGVSYPERGLGMRLDWYRSHCLCRIQTKSSWYQEMSNFAAEQFGMTSDPYSDQNSSPNIDSIIESRVHSTVQSRVQSPGFVLPRQCWSNWLHSICILLSVMESILWGCD